MNILILDDNDPTRRMLKKILEEDHSNVTVHTAGSYQEAEWIVNQESFDLALLDMEIGDGYTGIDVGKLIAEKNPDVEFMVVSSHPGYALDSFEIHPYDFHVKPINITSFKSSIRQVIEFIESKKSMNTRRASNEEGRLLVKTKKEIFWIPYSKIHFIEKLQKDVYIHTADDAVVIRQNISDIEKKLPTNFLRVHKSYIVNSDHISKIVEHGDRSYEVYFFNNEKTAYMSRYKASVLLDRLG